VIYQEDVKYNDMPRLIKDEIAEQGTARPSLDLRRTEKFLAAKVVTNQIPESLLEGTPYPLRWQSALTATLI